jgi:hypothetical protein
MLKSLWRTHSCVPRSHSCERWPSRLAYHWGSMLLVTIVPTPSASECGNASACG